MGLGSVTKLELKKNSWRMNNTPFLLLILKSLLFLITLD